MDHLGKKLLIYEILLVMFDHLGIETMEVIYREFH